MTPTDLLCKTAQENVMNARGEFRLFHIVWLINLKYNNNQYYADNHLIGTPKDSILDGNKDNINIHFP